MKYEVFNGSRDKFIVESWELLVIKRHALSGEVIKTISDIFDENNWLRKDEYIGIDYFNDYCNFISCFEGEKQDMLIRLSHEFVWIRDIQYTACLKKLVELLENQVKHEGKLKLCFIPAVDSNSIHGSKSSHLVIYKVKELGRYWKEFFPEITVSYCDNPLWFKEHKPNLKLCYIIIDDFIGSGESIRESIEFYLNLGFSSDMFVIASFVCMLKSFNSIQDQGYRIYALEKMPKGISDRMDGKAGEYTELMTEIETCMKVSDNERFGYSQTEALVNMARIPNNTFPVFWKNTKTYKDAPFRSRG